MLLTEDLRVGIVLDSALTTAVGDSNYSGRVAAYPLGALVVNGRKSAHCSSHDDVPLSIGS